MISPEDVEECKLEPEIVGIETGCRGAGVEINGDLNYIYLSASVKDEIWLCVARGGVFEGGE